MSEQPLVDQVFAKPRDKVAAFRFDDAVASVFPDMLNRSIPGYATIIDMIGILAARYAQKNTRLYDLGCSLGAASFAMARRVSVPGCRIVAVDNSQPMLDRARQLLHKEMPNNVSIEFLLSRLEEINWQSPASMAVLNFTLQFVALEQRRDLLTNIAQSLVPGGVLVLSEKICYPDTDEESLQQALYYAFKRNNGYSELEISQKRDALENVLVPETIETHRQRLLDVGFSDVRLWYRCFNFCSMIAIR